MSVAVVDGMHMSSVLEDAQKNDRNSNASLGDRMHAALQEERVEDVYKWAHYCSEVLLLLREHHMRLFFTKQRHSIVTLAPEARNQECPFRYKLGAHIHVAFAYT